MFPTDIRNTIMQYSDEVILKQIVSKCKLNQHIRICRGIIEIMAHRNRALHDYVPSPYISYQIWSQGISILKQQIFHNTTALEADVSSHPSIIAPSSKKST